MRANLMVFLVVIGCSKAREPEPKLTLQVPADSALLVSLSFNKLRASTYWPKLEAALASKLPLADLQRVCPDDPVRSIQSLQLAVPADLAPERATMIVRGVSRQVADACASSFAQSQKQPITINNEGALVAYRQGDDAVFASWLDSRTVAIAPGDLTSKDRLSALGSSKADPMLADAVAQLRGDHLVTLAFHATEQSELAGFLAQSGMEPVSGYGWLDLEPALHAEIVARFTTPERAASAAKQTFGGPLAKVKSTLKDRDVVFTFDLDATQTVQLIDQALAAAL
jgi:hypothetical protein